MQPLRNVVISTSWADLYLVAVTATGYIPEIRTCPQLEGHSPGDCSQGPGGSIMLGIPSKAPGATFFLGLKTIQSTGQTISQKRKKKGKLVVKE